MDASGFESPTRQKQGAVDLNRLPQWLQNILLVVLTIATVGGGLWYLVTLFRSLRGVPHV